VEHAARLLSTMAFDCFVKQDFQGVQVLEERANVSWRLFPGLSV